MLSPKTARTPGVVTAFFVFTFFVFTCVFPYISSFNNPNENVRIYMTMAVVEDHTFRIDNVLARHGYVNDMAKAPDKAGVPHLYSIKAPLVSYLGVPVYWAFTKIAPHFEHPVPTITSKTEDRAWWFTAVTAVLRLFVLQIPCFLFLVWYERYLREVSKDTALRLTVVAAVGLGTNFLAYSLMFVSHTLFGVAAFVSFALITRERARSRGLSLRRRKSIAFLAGLFAGLATLAEYQAFPVSCALALYAFAVFWRPTRLVPFLAGAGLNAGALMFYQWRCYGNPLTPGHKMAENPAFAAWHQQGFYGLGEPSWETFNELSFSHAFGFFGTSPFMWLGLLAVPFGIFFASGFPREREQGRVANFAWMFAMLCLWVPISAAVNWRGGWTLGPRFFGGAPPFFGFGALFALEHLSRRSGLRRGILRGIAGGLAIASIVELGFVGLVYNTYPETVTRPLTQMALPLARVGFVPHHAAELFGWKSSTFFYLVVGCLFVAALLAALWPAGDGKKVYALRLTLVIVACVLGLRPAFSDPEPDEIGDGAGDLHFFVASWEPAGRDALSLLRPEAERFGPRGPCLWHRIANLEHIVHMDSEAARDEARAGSTPASSCKSAPFE